MEIEMEFFLTEPNMWVNWDSPNIIRSEFTDFLGYHLGYYLPKDAAQTIKHKWDDWIKSEAFKIQFTDVVQNSDFSGKWKRWILNYLRYAGEIPFVYEKEQAILQLALMGESRIEILEKELRQMEFNLNTDFKIDTFDSSERKKSVKDVQSYCIELKTLLRDGKVWATQYWDYDVSSGRFMKGQFLVSFTPKVKTIPTPSIRTSQSLAELKVEGLFVSQKAIDKTIAAAKQIGLINEAGQWMLGKERKPLNALWKVLKEKGLVNLDLLRNEGKSVQLLATLFGINAGKNLGYNESDEKIEKELKAILERD